MKELRMLLLVACVAFFGVSSVEAQLLSTGARNDVGMVTLTSGTDVSGDNKGAVVILDYGATMIDWFALVGFSTKNKMDAESWKSAGVGFGVKIIDSRLLDVALWPTMQVFDGDVRSYSFIPLPTASGPVASLHWFTVQWYAGFTAAMDIKSRDWSYVDSTVGVVLGHPKLPGMDVRFERNIKTKKWSFGASVVLKTGS